MTINDLFKFFSDVDFGNFVSLFAIVGFLIYIGYFFITMNHLDLSAKASPIINKYLRFYVVAFYFFYGSGLYWANEINYLSQPFIPILVSIGLFLFYLCVVKKEKNQNKISNWNSIVQLLSIVGIPFIHGYLSYVLFINMINSFDESVKIIDFFSNISFFLLSFSSLSIFFGGILIPTFFKEKNMIFYFADPSLITDLTEPQSNNIEGLFIDEDDSFFLIKKTDGEYIKINKSLIKYYKKK